jgi:hypothetical protein
MREYVKLIEETEIKIERLIRPSYLLGDDIKKYESYVVRIREILRVLKNTGSILKSNEVPLYLVNKFDEIFDGFKMYHVDPFTTGISETTEAANNYRTAMNNVERYHNEFFEISTTNYKLFLINTIDNYKLQDSLLIEGKANQIIDGLQGAK